MHRVILVAAVILLALIPNHSFARIGATVHSTDDSTGLFRFDVYVKSGRHRRLSRIKGGVRHAIPSRRKPVDWIRAMLDSAAR